MQLLEGRALQAEVSKGFVLKIKQKDSSLALGVGLVTVGQI